jgi:hypothetical protein
MKKLFAMAVGITVILSLILAIPTMANTPTFQKNAPHYDVNLVTGLTDPSYQIKVDAVTNTTAYPSGIQIVFIFKDITSIQIHDYDGTDGYAEVWLPAIYKYDVFAQARGKGDSYGEFNLVTLSAKSVWTWVTTCSGSEESAADNYFFNDGCGSGSRNFCLRLCYSLK